MVQPPATPADDPTATAIMAVGLAGAVGLAVGLAGAVASHIFEVSEAAVHAVEAAAFGAPIGAVLFSLEEASSWWSHKLMWRALTATTLATVLLHLCEKGFKLKESNLAVYGLLSLEVPRTFISKFEPLLHGVLTLGGED